MSQLAIAGAGATLDFLDIKLRIPAGQSVTVPASIQTSDLVGWIQGGAVTVVPTVLPPGVFIAAPVAVGILREFVAAPATVPTPVAVAGFSQAFPLQQYVHPITAQPGGLPGGDRVLCPVSAALTGWHSARLVTTTGGFNIYELTKIK